MDLKEAILNRRSVRKFTDQKISRDIIEEIIAAGSWAPSACDKQLCRFIVIDSPEIKEKIACAGGSQIIKSSPVGILVLYDNRTDNLEYRDYLQSAAAAIQNMLLMATDLGIGSCWICHLPLKNTLRSLLRIPDYFDPIAYVVLGYSEVKPKSRPRKFELKEMIASNEFNFKVYSGPNFRLRKILKAAYLRLPSFLKKWLRPIAEKFVVKFE